MFSGAFVSPSLLITKELVLVLLVAKGRHPVQDSTIKKRLSVCDLGNFGYLLPSDTFKSRISNNVDRALSPFFLAFSVLLALHVGFGYPVLQPESL